MLHADQQLLTQGLDLMIYGMLTVFVFLTLLVTIITLVSMVMNRFFSKPLVPECPSEASSVVMADRKLLMVLQTAVDQHRGRYRG